MSKRPAPSIIIATKTTTIDPASLLRLRQVLQLLPISASSWWEGIKKGRYPKPVKLGPKTTCWRAADIIALIESAGDQEPVLSSGSASKIAAASV